MNTFDLIILGGGAAAFGAAIKANDLGAKAVMVNAGLPLGGTCVNVGCVPSKTLLRAGEVLHLAGHHGVPGIELKVERFDFASVVRDELALVARLREEKYQQVLQHLQHVTFIEGRARFTSPTEVEVDGRRLHAPKVIVATGSTATVPSIAAIRPKTAPIGSSPMRFCSGPAKPRTRPAWASMRPASTSTARSPSACNRFCRRHSHQSSRRATSRICRSVSR